MTKKRKNSILIFISLTLILVAILFLVTRRSGTISSDEKSFAVSDTSAIEKIFIADGNENNVLLEKTGKGWIVNHKHEVMKNNIDDLLNCIANLTMKAPVGKSARDNINKRMASGAVKVEIYFKDYYIKLGSLRLWEYTNTKIYYLGQQTMDNLGNYAILEGAKIPCVVYLPGFRGFVRPKYSPFEDSWRTHNIVKLKLSQIQLVKIVDYEIPEQSMLIEKGTGKHFNIYNANGEKLPQYDTLKLLDHLSDYRNLNYEMQDMELQESEKDSIFMNLFKEISITDIHNKTTKITMFRINTILDTANYDYNLEFIDAYNKDKFYAIVNDNKNEVYLCQFFVFDRIVQPLEYYLPNNQHRAIPIVREISDNDK